MEARTRAIIAAGGSRSRATSPNPGARNHRRVPSTGGPETRFPIQTSPTSATTNGRHSTGHLAIRNSLEVPGGDGISPAEATALANATNGFGDHGFSPGPAVPAKPSTAPVVIKGAENKSQGVSLTDKPMDD
jgi:hypothetical protein